MRIQTLQPKLDTSTVAGAEARPLPAWLRRWAHWHPKRRLRRLDASSRSKLNFHFKMTFRPGCSTALMGSTSDFSAKCGDIRASARQLLKDQASREQDPPKETDGVTVAAAPEALRMSMGEIRKTKPITLCTFSRSELMSVLYIRHHAHFLCHPLCSSSDCTYEPGPIPARPSPSI